MTTLELWTHTDHRDPPTDIIATLDRLVRTGAIEEYRLQTWPRCVPLTEPRDDRQRRQAGRILAVALWAAQADVTLPTMGPTRRVGCGRMAPADLAIDAPPMLLVEFDDDDVTFVAPCDDGETVHTVRSRLARLEAGHPMRTDPVPEVITV